MKLNQILGIVIVLIGLAINFVDNNPTDLLNPLPPNEQVLLDKVEGLAPPEVIRMVASDLLAAANFIEMDQNIGDGALSDSLSIKDLKYQQNKMLWAHRIDMPSQYPELANALYKIYEENLGNDFTPEELVNFNRTMSRALNRA